MLGELDQSPELTALERAVLRTALQANSMVTLREQATSATVTMRIPSGVGFVTKLKLDAGAPLAAGHLEPPRVFGIHPDLRSGAEFVTQVKNGRINSIEAFCFEGLWPADETAFRLSLTRQA